MRLFSFDDPVHREATLLLPWYVNGTLEGAERARTDRHVRECVACKGEVEAQTLILRLLRVSLVCTCGLHSNPCPLIAGQRPVDWNPSQTQLTG